MSQNLIDLMIMACGSIVVWSLRVSWNSLQDIRNDLAELRAELPKNYVEKENYREDTKELKDLIIKLSDHFIDCRQNHEGS